MSKTAREDRFLKFLQEHKKILYKVANGYCRRPEDRPDLEQEIVVQLWRSFGRYDDSYRFSTWMYRIALNVAISWSRRDRRRVRHTVSSEESILELPADDTAERDRDLRLLQEIIQGLDELDRSLILLYLDGHSHQEIAEILGITPTNVGTKIGRIKQRLRKEHQT